LRRESEKTKNWHLVKKEGRQRPGQVGAGNPGAEIENDNENIGGGVWTGFWTVMGRREQAPASYTGPWCLSKQAMRGGRKRPTAEGKRDGKQE